MIDYKEYMDMFSKGKDDDTTDNNDDSITTNNNNNINSNGDDTSKITDDNKVPIAKIVPYGADEIREIMIQRKQLEQSRQRDERLRRQAYKDALDIKIFEEELEAGRNRKGGANPSVTLTKSIPGNPYIYICS
jgi:hypothetical protein